MNRYGSIELWFGFLLIGGGALWLANAVGIHLSPVVPAAFFGIAGLGFAFEFMRDAHTWWTAIIAGPLLGLSALIVAVEYAAVPGPWGATLLLAASGLGFGAVYLRTHEHGWALIPTGLLLIVSVIVAAVPVAGKQEDIAVLVLAVIAVALVGLAFIPIRGRRLLWPIVPAAIVAVVGWFISRGEARVLEPYNWVSAAALLALGVFVLARTFSGRGAGRPDA